MSGQPPPSTTPVGPTPAGPKSTGPVVTPEQEARFKKIAERIPPYNTKQLQLKLAEPPAVEVSFYSRWFVNYRAQQVMDDYNAPPMPIAKVFDLIKGIAFDDPYAVSQLYFEMSKPAGIDVFPLGNYTVGKTTNYLYLSFSLSLLPKDFDTDMTRADTMLTQAKYAPVTPGLPTFFYELGYLLVSTASTLDKVPAQVTGFVVVVAPNRKVFGLWNPISSDLDGLNDSNDNSYVDRSTSGVLDAFTAPCTCFPLADNIDQLCNPNQISKALTISPSTMITLAPKGVIKFGGVDNDGWIDLPKAFPMFDSKKRFAAST